LEKAIDIRKKRIREVIRKADGVAKTIDEQSKSLNKQESVVNEEKEFAEDTCE
jgi:hypothetical protein